MPKLRDFVHGLLSSQLYKNGLIFLVYLNLLILVLEADYTALSESNRGTPLYDFYRILDLVFLGVYTVEFCAHVFVNPWGYWTYGYNLVDFVVMLIYWAEWISSCLTVNFLASQYTALRFLRGMRALRAIRLIPHYRQIEVVVNALLITMKTNVVDVVFLLLLVIFVFGVIGHYLFGDNLSHTHSIANWVTLGDSFYTLWVFVCVCQLFTHSLKTGRWMDALSRSPSRGWLTRKRSIYGTLYFSGKFHYW